MENNLVKVLLWGQEVGVMYWDASASRAIFEYSPDYLRIWMQALAGIGQIR